MGDTEQALRGVGEDIAGQTLVSQVSGLRRVMQDA